MRLLVALGSLGLILTRIDLRTVKLSLSVGLLAAVGAATALLLLSQAAAALRWRIVLGERRLRWGYLLRLYVIGSFFSLFLPTSVGGDGVRALAAARFSARAGRAMASVVIDRMLGVLAAIAFAVLGLSLAPDDLAGLAAQGVDWHLPGPIVVAVFVLVVVLAGLLIARSTRARRLWHDGITTVVDLARSPRDLPPLFLLAMASQGLIIAIWYTLARGMNLALPPAMFLWAAPVVALGTLLPITFSGLGVREAVWLTLLARSSVPQGTVVAFSLLYFVCTMLVGLIGGVLFISLGIAPPAVDQA